MVRVKGVETKLSLLPDLITSGQIKKIGNSFYVKIGQAEGKRLGKGNIYTLMFYYIENGQGGEKLE